MNEHPKDFVDCWADRASSDPQWPDHEWAGDEHGHNCAKCVPESPWRCDRIAHNIAMTMRAEKLLKAIEQEDA